MLRSNRDDDKHRGGKGLNHDDTNNTSLQKTPHRKLTITNRGNCVVMIGFIIVTMLLANTVTFTNVMMNYQQEPVITQLAAKESLGFFTDVPDHAWQRHKKRFQLTQPNYSQNKAEIDRLSRYSNHFWAENFEPEFTCPHEFRLGKLGDGGKWVCDPYRILADTGNGKDAEGKCLVYSVGSNGNFDFEVEALKHVSPDCEIHTFDAMKQGRRKDFAAIAEKIQGITFHHTGVGPTSQRQSHFKRFGDIIVDLGHQNRVIDLMKIDCERCEYAQYKQWLEDWKETNVLVRQVMLEVHNSDYPGVVDIFNVFQKAGYVLFHKEANFMNEGKAVEVAWILLDADFQVPE